VEGAFSWVGTEWKRDLVYMPDTLVTQVSLYHKDMELLLVCRDAVDFHEDVYVREISIENMSSHAREIRLFFVQDFDISGNSVGDTAALDPITGGVVHYKGTRYFLANGCGATNGGISQSATGQKGIEGKEGTFKDAEDGVLSGNPIAQGSVDSVIALHITVEALSEAKGYYWIAAGQTWDEVRSLDALVKERRPENLIKRTADFWHIWANKETPPIEELPEKVANLYRRSLLVLRTQIDWQGGILAGNDSDVIQYNRDTYSYVWPRDGALVANALDLAGYWGLAQEFYRFIAGLCGKEGYFLHKYNPDGTLASSWHPWLQDGQLQLPIQEDETALIIWALWNHFVLYRDIEFIKPFYRSLIIAAADFMTEYRDKKTGLPAPSYDLWEERRGILSYTVGTVFGGLTAASLFCSIFGQDDKADRYRQVAAEIRDATSTYLWREDLGRFCRMINCAPDGSIQVDAACDSSLWGLFAFGLYSVDDPRIASTMAALKEALWAKTRVGGMARYENDSYYRVAGEVTGNPWFICTLWLADYWIEKAANEEEIRHAVDILAWVADHALPSGVLAEQVHPLKGEPLSVSPLTWSHATYVATVQHVLRRLQRIRLCPQCGLPLMIRGRQEDWIEKMYGKACDSIRGICRIR